MKSKLLFIMLVIISALSAQNTTITYQPSDAIFANPDRGFFKIFDSDDIAQLDLPALTALRTQENVTLIYRCYYLGDFINSSNISDAYKANIQADMEKIRAAGLKVILRFAYSKVTLDATKDIMISHIIELAPVINANTDIISVLQAGFIGGFGEWYYTSQSEFGFGGTVLTAANYASRKEITDTLLGNINPAVFIQLRTPYYKSYMYGDTAVTGMTAYNGSSISRIGFFNDCFLGDFQNKGTYEFSNEAAQRLYLHNQTLYLPMGGESCMLNAPDTDCAQALVELEDYHWSFINKYYKEEVIAEWASQGCFSTIEKRLGYRFQLTDATFPVAINPAAPLPVSINLINLGFAAPFGERYAVLVLRNTGTQQEFKITLNSSPRFWTSTQAISETLNLPSGIPEGHYHLFLSLADVAITTGLNLRPEYAIRFANENMWEAATGYNDLGHTLFISPALSMGQTVAPVGVKLSPVPSDQFLDIESDGSVSVSRLYDISGKEFHVDQTLNGNLIRLNISALADGFYYVQLNGSQSSIVKKIIIRH